MLLFRSLTVGLLGACVLLLVRLDTAPRAVASPQQLATVVMTAPITVATIIDVGAGLQAGELAGLVHLAPGEHVAAVDDRPVASDLDAGTMIARLPASERGFVDLDVAAADGVHRRVLVLRH